MSCGKETKKGKPCKNTKNCHAHKKRKAENILEVKSKKRRIVQDRLEFIPENFEQIFNDLQGELKTVTYTPKTIFIDNQFKDGDFDKFGGAPSVEKNFVWPWCKYCKTKLTFFFQLTPPEIYQKNPGHAIQMFNCADCADTPLVRWIDYQQTDDRTILDSHCIPFPDSVVNIVLSYSSGYSILNNTSERDLAAYDKNHRQHMYHENGIVDRDYKKAMPCFKIVGWDEKLELNCDIEKLSSRFSINGEYKNFTLQIGAFFDTFCDLEAGLKFGGQIQCAQDLDHGPDEFLHFQECSYMPYMWGDAGDAHISYDLDFGFCCG